MVVNERTDTKGLTRDNLVIAVNRRVDLGRGWSVRIGLQSVPAGYACFIHNVDNPYIRPELIRGMFEQVRPGSWVVPVNAGRGGHPVLLSSDIAGHLRQAPPGDLREALARFERIELPWNDGRITWNINNPEDYREYLLASVDT
jgi:CTP:molybdopterin cytidylyltransferase MocA